jgi:peptidoglycan hydrolase CwlO-like protein
MNAELKKLQAERDELRATVEAQHDDLATLRREIAALRHQLSEIRDLLHRRYRLSAAVEMELVQRLQQTPPARN